jgi:hypothetical protein
MTDNKGNTGYYNTGYYNTGYCNTGDYNTGNRNTGDYNTGDYNTGNRNTGDYNTGDYNTGYCNSIAPEDCLIFNKPAKRQDWIDADKPEWLYAQLTQWVPESKMTDKEKGAYPSYATAGGYLKAHGSLQDAWREAWDKASPEDRAKTFKLPNFDIDVFEEVFGFRPEKPGGCSGEIITVKGKKYRLQPVEEDQ